MNFLNSKGQTTLEYVLLLAGLIVIIVLISVLIRGGVFAPAQEDIGSSVATIKGQIASVKG